MPYADRTWLSHDGLTLHYRDYPGDADRTPVLCVPGLTRNARDFAVLAEGLAGKRRVIVAELRGRGESQYASDPMTYVPPVYAGDILALHQQLGVGPVAWIGTSLGGIVAMIFAAMTPDLLAGVLLNDIGPVIEPEGIARISSYAGKGAGWPDWQAAAAAQAETHVAAYPDYGSADWVEMAHRLCREAPDGRIVTDYDPDIAVPFAAPPPDPAPDPWPLLNGLAGKPALLVRGGLSDILSEATAVRMAETLPQMGRLTLPRIGHAPTLEEPECGPAIAGWLDRIDRGSRREPVTTLIAQS